ncbi:hypothetical protein HOLleu_09181 [Holothuria leucospilota]|uniref:Uncharacterized protein n=1 Tax=Holothuria leucospilota TaxID=206669 RepID=A0A9Q1CK39_HOLLE|nr:hypothetical protein HOLleu_09181 [Holothuria leucospilota]
MDMQAHNSNKGELTWDSVQALTSHIQLQASRNNTAAKKLLHQNVSTLKKMESKELVAISAQQKRIVKDIKKVKNRSRGVDIWLQESMKRNEGKRAMEYEQIQRRITRMKHIAGSWKKSASIQSMAGTTGKFHEISGYDRFGNYQRLSGNSFDSKYHGINIMEDSEKNVGESWRQPVTENGRFPTILKLPKISETRNASKLDRQKKSSMDYAVENRLVSKGVLPNTFSNSEEKRKQGDSSKLRGRFYLLGLTVGKLAVKTSSITKSRRPSVESRRLSVDTSYRSSVDRRRLSVDKRKSSVDTRRFSVDSWTHREGLANRRKQNLLPADKGDINHMSTKGFHLFDYRSQLLNLGRQGDESSDESENSESSNDEFF